MSANVAKATDIRPDHMLAAYPSIWARELGILLDGRPLDMVGHSYQFDVLDAPERVQCAKKGAQIGFTSIGLIRTIHGLIYRKYPQGSLYLFPTRDDVTDFSKGRFGPLISDNPAINYHVRDTDAANIKRIGSSMLYMRGARSTRKIEGVKATASQLKSVPVDRVTFDEVDEMDPTMVALALERMSHSSIREEFYLSTPSIPDYGIDKLYQASDQRVWMIKCGKCGSDTCLELEFPACITEDGRRLCTKCREEIYPRNGRWVAQYPDREIVGWWISQLNSPVVNPAAVLRAYLDPEGQTPPLTRQEVYNSKLGQAWIEAENRLTREEVYARCTREPMPGTSRGPCWMGVDVGKTLHVVIGHKATDKHHVIDKLIRVDDFTALHDLAKSYNVRCAVLDALPETRKVREFAEAENFPVWLCYYAEVPRLTQWNAESKEVRVSRTEVCDATHFLVAGGGELGQTVSLPRKSTEVERYALEMCNIAKVLVEDIDTGSREYTYRKLGPDHYRHATNYAWLAAQRVGLASASASGHVRRGPSRDWRAA